MFGLIDWPGLWWSLGETLSMAMVATVMASLLALPLSFCSSPLFCPIWISFPLRQFLNFCRAIPALVWALLFVSLYGFGVITGILALCVYSVGYLGKFFADSFERIDQRPSTALRELGASPVECFMHATLPGARSLLIANVLFVFEYNVRSAAVLGIVDAGGIGFYLKQYLDLREFQAAGACLALVFLMVMGVDALSQQARRVLDADRYERKG
jgi:phosphonate transport system permease protein